MSILDKENQLQAKKVSLIDVCHFEHNYNKVMSSHSSQSSSVFSSLIWSELFCKSATLCFIRPTKMSLNYRGKYCNQQSERPTKAQYSQRIIGLFQKQTVLFCYSITVHIVYLMSLKSFLPTLTKDLQFCKYYLFLGILEYVLDKPRLWVGYTNIICTSR